MVSSGNGEEAARAGYYPDPSIPGYIRYWDGDAWVPGTSRPAPRPGEEMPSPPAGYPLPEPDPAPTDETGPVFLDEDPAIEGTGDGGGRALPELRQRGEVDLRQLGTPDPQPEPQSMAWDDPQRLHGSRPEPAAAWGADVSRQAGFGDGPGRGVPGAAGDSSAPVPDPRLPGARAGAVESGSGGAGQDKQTVTFRRDEQSGRTPATPTGDPGGTTPAGGTGPEATDGTMTIRAAGRPGEGERPEAADGTMMIRAAGRPEGGEGPGATDGTMMIRAAGRPEGGEGPGATDGTLTIRAAGRPEGGAGPGAADGTMAIRALRPGEAAAGAGSGAAERRGDGEPPALPPAGPDPRGPVGADPGTMAIRSLGPARGDAPGRGGPAPLPPREDLPVRPAQPTPPAIPDPRQAHGVPGPAAVSAPGQGAAGAAPPSPQPSWAQQVQQLAQPEGPADAPAGVHTGWRPPVSDPFLQAAQDQAAARPASLGKRLVARVIDALLLGLLLAAAAVPLGTRAVGHVDDKIEAAKLSGETVTVWLVDGTTGAYLGILVGVLLLLGVVYEVLPTARWGRTLGKRLCGLRVLDIESHSTPTFGQALRRWLVYSVLGLLAVGVVNVVWCLFDRPWRQCWHDKAAHTFVGS
ncbi:RDD family protein [Streptomyces sp. TP-A0874]|uniref:RDD family protein n=1 Tax=Streptomyces sp. TP-A0874 TaxID=549819 RepID=UPI000852BF06|nr:RDD family protein [Streptomyces sp. TP-A0874]